MQKTIEIAGTKVKPGSRQSIDIPLPSFYTHSSVNMPVQVVHGRQDGPKLLVSAAIHGDEINGVEIIRRLLAHKSVNRIKGTLIAIPVVNVYGFVSKSRYLPDRRDLNRSFPGSENGSMASRLANVLMTQILPHCDHIIDLHTGAVYRENLPQIRARLRDKRGVEIACGGVWRTGSTQCRCARGFISRCRSRKGYRRVALRGRRSTTF